jgi:hypothetical protein
MAAPAPAVVPPPATIAPLFPPHVAHIFTRVTIPGEDDTLDYVAVPATAGVVKGLPDLGWRNSSAHDFKLQHQGCSKRKCKASEPSRLYAPSPEVATIAAARNLELREKARSTARCVKRVCYGSQMGAVALGRGGDGWRRQYE